MRRHRRGKACGWSGYWLPVPQPGAGGGQELARQLGVDYGSVLEHEKVIEEATHVLLLGHFSSEIQFSGEAQGKPMQTIIRGRFLPPPGGWPRCHEEPERPA